MTSGIYKIANLLNGKVYVGSAVHLRGRKNKHFSQLKHNKHCNKYLQRAYNKYGSEAFLWEVLENCPVNDLIAWEQAYFGCYEDLVGWKNMYNICRKAGSSLGIKFGPPSEEARKNMSEAHKGEKNHFFGKTHSEERRRKMSEAHKGEKNPLWGKPRSEETRKKIGEGLSKPVIAICIKTGKTTEFSSAMEAERQWPGAKNSLISACCLGKRKTHFQHYWRFINQPANPVTEKFARLHLE